MSSESKLLRGSLISTGVVGAISLVLSTVLTGAAGFYGALLAQFIVIIFFATSIWISKLTRDADPMATMAIAMASYFIKLFIFAGFLILITKLVPVDYCNRLAFGLSAIAATLAWLGGEISAYLNLKTHLQLPEKK